MSKLRRSWIVLLAAVGLLTAAGVASADDTLINVGYDEDNHVLVVNSAPTDAPYDCTLQNGPFRIGYGAVESGPIPVNTLETEVEPGAVKAYLFANRPAEEVGDDFTVATEPLEYSFAGDCGLSGGVVGGPNGQINHGQFMKTFHQLVDTKGNGCLNRVMAQSDLGKDDQQLRTADVDDTFAPGETGTVQFETFLATCEHGKKDKGEDAPGAKKADRTDPPGKSGNARGRNK